MSQAQELGARITALCSQIYAAEYRLLTLIREFDEHKYWAEPGLMSCAHWLNFKCGISMNAARERVRVAHALKDLPRISACFEKGELSYSKVRAMTRIADACNEDYLLMIAKHGTAHHVEKLVSKYRWARRLQDAEVAEQVYASRELSHHYDHDGCLVIRARLPAEQGALVVKALERAMEQQFREAGSQQADEAEELRERDEAQQPGEAGQSGEPVKTGKAGEAGQKKVSEFNSGTLLVDTAADGEVSAETPEREQDHVPIAARRADAFVEIAESYLNHGESAGSTADRYQVVVHVSAETLARHNDVGIVASEGVGDDRLGNPDGVPLDVSAETSGSRARLADQPESLASAAGKNFSKQPGAENRAAELTATVARNDEGSEIPDTCRPDVLAETSGSRARLADQPESLASATGKNFSKQAGAKNRAAELTATVARNDEGSEIPDTCRPDVSAETPEPDCCGRGGVFAETVLLEDGPHVTAETSRRIGCDSAISHLLEGQGGEPLAIGRRSRTIPPPMRRALRARDGGCRFPGCTRTRFVDGHHIRHWADGGETCLDNLVLLCRRHHRLVHEGGFACETTGSGEVVFRDTGARPLPEYWPLPGISNDELQRWQDNEVFEPGIRPEACVTRWQGEHMDYQMAVSALMQRVDL